MAAAAPPTKSSSSMRKSSRVRFEGEPEAKQERKENTENECNGSTGAQ